MTTDRLNRITSRLHLRRPARRTLALLIAPIAVLLTTAGQCDPPASYPPCSPSYTDTDSWGVADISQSAPGAQIVYSLYSSNSTANSRGTWVTTIYMDGQKEDTFKQTGNPQGHVLTQNHVRAGGIFEIQGEVNWTDNNGALVWGQDYKAFCQA